MQYFHSIFRYTLVGWTSSLLCQALLHSGERYSDSSSAPKTIKCSGNDLEYTEQHGGSSVVRVFVSEAVPVARFTSHDSYP